MGKYVIFISSRGGKAVPKDQVTSSLIKEMKRQGFRKHHLDVDAENEADAVKALNQFNDDYLTEVKEYSASTIFICLCAMVIFIVFLFSNSWRIYAARLTNTGSQTGFQRQPESSVGGTGGAKQAIIVCSSSFAGAES
jgi:hypothetical protein